MRMRETLSVYDLGSLEDVLPDLAPGDAYEIEMDRQIERMWDKSQKNKDPLGKRFEEGIVQGFETAKILYKTHKEML